METWYKAGDYARNLIEPATVVKSTDKTVLIRAKSWNDRVYESRRAIVSGSHCFFRTWEEARAHLLAKAESEVDSLRRQLEAANGKLGNVRGMKKPS